MKTYNFKKRLVIGSANFSQIYGIFPIRVKKNEIEKILNFSLKNNIDTIDTAEAYLEKNKIFQNNKKFKLLTKITPDTNWTSLEFCQKKIDNHLKNLNKNKVDVIFFHDIKILLKKDGIKIFKNLELLKKKYFNKIGFSIYDTNNLEYLSENYNFDVLQCPYNILDKRIINSGWFDKLKYQDKEIYVRSIFLQGILVNESIYQKKYFKKWQNLFSYWFKYLEKNNISAIEYCFSDIINYGFDKIIVGINSMENLKEILNFKKIEKKKIKNFEINDLKLIDPRNWK